MGRIFKQISLQGTTNKYKKLVALFDTGAGHNYIGEEFNDGSSIYDLGILEYGKEKDVVLPDGSTIICKKIKLKLLKIDKVEPIIEPEFFLFDMKKCEVIIGAELMQQLRMVLKSSIKEINFE